MNTETLQALQGSIAKWAAIVDSTDAVDAGGSNCPLCKVFDRGLECKGCPADKGQGACVDTPYVEWGEHQINNHSGLLVSSAGRVWHRFENCNACLNLAKAERDFLISLLPPGNFALPFRILMGLVES